MNGGRFDETYSRIRSQIDELVKTDPTAFYDYAEYETAAQMLYDTVKLRAESIAGQLDGSIPSTDDGQRADSSALIDASQIDVKAMEQFCMGGFGGQRGNTDTQSGSEEENALPTDKQDTDNLPNSESPPASDEQTDRTASDETPTAGVHRQRPSFGGMPEQSADSSKAKTQNLITFGVCFAVILAAPVLAKIYKRRK